MLEFGVLFIGRFDGAVGDQIHLADHKNVIKLVALVLIEKLKHFKLFGIILITNYKRCSTLKAVALISPVSSIRSTLNNFPDPLALFQVRMSLFDVTRAFKNSSYDCNQSAYKQPTYLNGPLVVVRRERVYGRVGVSPSLLYLGRALRSSCISPERIAAVKPACSSFVGLLGLRGVLCRRIAWSLACSGASIRVEVLIGRLLGSWAEWPGVPNFATNLAIGLTCQDILE